MVRPATLLFTVTGFTRILIVLGFIRSGRGTPTAPPNQVLVGIAFFLTLFVMSPTLKEIKTEAYDPRADRWTSLKPMMTPRHGMGAVTDLSLLEPGEHRDLVVPVRREVRRTPA